MAFLVNISQILGSEPFNVYACDFNGTNCQFISTINESDLPFSFELPVVLSESSYCISIIDELGCDINNCSAVTPTVTPSNTVTPTITMTVTQTPTNTVTPSPTRPLVYYAGVECCDGTIIQLYDITYGDIISDGDYFYISGHSVSDPNQIITGCYQIRTSLSGGTVYEVELYGDGSASPYSDCGTCLTDRSLACSLTPTPTYTQTPTLTPSPTTTITPTNTITPTTSPTQTLSPTNTTTPTTTISPTTTPSPTNTQTPTNTITPTTTQTPTKTPTNTVTPTSSETPTQTPTNTVTPTTTETPTLTPTLTPTPSVTETPDQSPTPTPTNTPTNTSTPTNTITPTNSLTPTSTLTPTQTITPTSTVTPTQTITPTSTVTPTKTVTPTNTNTPTRTVTPTNTLTPTATITPTPTRVPSNMISFYDCCNETYFSILTGGTFTLLGSTFPEIGQTGQVGITNGPLTQNKCYTRVSPSNSYTQYTLNSGYYIWNSVSYADCVDCVNNAPNASCQVNNVSFSSCCTNQIFRVSTALNPPMIGESAKVINQVPVGGVQDFVLNSCYQRIEYNVAHTIGAGVVSFIYGSTYETCSSCVSENPCPSTPTPTPTHTVTPTVTPTITTTPTRTVTPTKTVTPTFTPTRTVTPTIAQTYSVQSCATKLRPDLIDVAYNLSGFNFTSNTSYSVGQTLEVSIQITAGCAGCKFFIDECYSIIPYNASLPSKPSTYTVNTIVTCGEGKCDITYIGLQECGETDKFVTSANISNLTAQTYNVGNTVRIPTLLPIAPTYLTGHEFSGVCFEIIAPQSSLNLLQTGIFGDEWALNQNGFLKASGCLSTNCDDCRQNVILVNTDDVPQTITYDLCYGGSTSSTIPASSQITQSSCINVVSFMNNTPASGQVFFSGGTSC